jgi:nitrite reductase/ring-hydroxylating ferredoxin subunit
MRRISDYKDDDGDDYSSNNDNKSSTFCYLCTIKDLPTAGKSRQFLMSIDKGSKKIQIAIFNVDGKYFCISNKCQHQGGPLSEGILDEEKKVVTSLAWLEIFYS